ncbi:MAG: hypothetical protein ACRERV_11465 [Methylococcales bacterium]
MIKTLIGVLAAWLVVSAGGIALEVDPLQDWRDIDGVNVQPRERVDQINAHQKKLLKAERKKFKKIWTQKGITVQSEERVEELNKRAKQSREKEIRELKCAMCTTRCNIVRDAGLEICSGPEPSAADSELCTRQADQFLQACIGECEHCVAEMR